MGKKVTITNTGAKAQSIQAASSYDLLNVPPTVEDGSNAVVINLTDKVVMSATKQRDYYINTYNGVNGLSVVYDAGTDYADVTFYVLTSAGSAIPGATVTIGEEDPITTNAQGVAVAANLVPASYTATIAATGYANKTVAFVVADTSNMIIQAGMSVNLFNLAVKVTDITGTAIEGVSVAVNGNEAVLTNATGDVTIADLSASTHSIVLSKTGLTSRTISITMTGTQAVYATMVTAG